MPIDVFISYRGADRVLARRLENRLRSRWGTRVFRDETSLMAGHSWSEQLQKAMSQAKVMLALIGPGWRIRENEEDWVRNELLGAIESGNAVLPVLVGDPDKLKDRLAELPEAFNRQAVKVSSELAGFDLHKVEKALRDLGAFGDRESGGLSRQLTEMLPEQCVELIDALLKGRSIVVSGASGSGRSVLLQRIASRVKQQGELLAASGIDLRARHRRTHNVIAAWIDALCELIETQPAEQRAIYGAALVKAVLEYGPDLLSRQVLRPASLLQLSDDESDQKILDAARRRIDKWAPFPPERLVSQSLSVIERFSSDTQSPLTLIVDSVESIDGSSKDLLRRLLYSKPANIRLVIATSDVDRGAHHHSAAHDAALTLNIDPGVFDNFRAVAMQHSELWGKPGTLIERWLERHNVCLKEGISENIINTNPFYALSALWFLVDNGHLIEEPELSVTTAHENHSPDDDVVNWLPARPDEPLVVPSTDQLLAHMIEEFVPVRFRPIIEAGSLMGRRFLFSAAFAAAHPPDSIDGQAPGSEAIKRWSNDARKCWEQFEKIDPDGSVLVCHRSADNERMINLAQADLVTHLANQFNDEDKRHCHRRLAEYFNKPIAEDNSSTLDDKYRNARAAAKHWAFANEQRHAADAERIAAVHAEKALAYPEARKHYRQAIRLFTQLLADKDNWLPLELVNHEDLLILAICQYRLGQMTRLSSGHESSAYESTDPSTYFKHALSRLEELTKNLHDKHINAPNADHLSTYTQRDLPEPNVIRHHIRLCETLSGRVKLELAECYEESDTRESRRLLFDALRHAEAARGEADSRALLAAASARLAQKLVEDAAEASQAGYGTRSHNLAIEAQFHIERIIGLAAVSPEEDRNLDEPRALAWTVLGQLFHTVKQDQQLAAYAFMKMNDHGHQVSELVDMMTDRRLGQFLLATYRGEDSDKTDEARELLETHMRWALESGITSEHSGAYVSLALLELVQQLTHRPLQLGKARQYIAQAIDSASDACQRQDAYLLQGLLHAIEHYDNGGVAHDDPLVVQAFRQADIEDIAKSTSDEGILFAGWRTLLLKLLRWCPYAEQWIGVQRCLQEPVLQDASDWTRHRFFSSLVESNRGELRHALLRAQALLDSESHEMLVPGSDAKIWCLLENRVPADCFEHARKVQQSAHDLLDTYRHLWNDEETELLLLRQDIDYAIVVHEWYRSTDPSRLLTLARESNMPIDGHEWASPKLLSGRLAIRVLDKQYGAGQDIGQRRIRQIESMVGNWAQSSIDASPVDQIFYIALQRHEPKRREDPAAWQSRDTTPHSLDDVYRFSIEERENLVRQAGLGLVQDLHLLDIQSDASSSAPGNTSSSTQETRWRRQEADRFSA